MKLEINIGEHEAGGTCTDTDGVEVRLKEMAWREEKRRRTKKDFC